MYSTKTSCIAAGDIFISRRLPERKYEGFEEFRQLVLQHEVRFANLEILFLDNEGYPGSSTGTYAMGPPAAIEDVKSLGFNLFNTANNHALDFSHNGLMAHLGYLRQHGILHAGAGGNLDEAAAPAYLECKDARVGLIGACSTLGKNLHAGIPRGDMSGRPGVNPLGFETRYNVTAAQIEQLKEIAKATQINVTHEKYVRAGFQIAPKDGYYFGGSIFCESETPGMITRVLERDMQRIISTVKEVRRQADYAIVSIHSHESEPTGANAPPEFIHEFCRRCIDEGASVVIGHGPHRVRGVELYGNGVIFYSLGNVLFENDTVRLQPADFYQHYSLPVDSQVGEGLDARERSGAAAREKYGTPGLAEIQGPGLYETVLAAWDMEDGRIFNVRLYPVSMGVELPRYRRGLPSLSKDEKILQYIHELSREYNTGIDIKDGVGYVKPL
ncbi:MAG: CapA family protein [Clostridiales bacterium]|nr:CapA family protein [Clostridiales bacterium]